MAAQLVDGLSEATSPLTFNRFIEMMGKDQAKDLVRTINTWVRHCRDQRALPCIASPAVHRQPCPALADHGVAGD